MSTYQNFRFSALNPRQIVADKDDADPRNSINVHVTVGGCIVADLDSGYINPKLRDAIEAVIRGESVGTVKRTQGRQRR